MAREQERDALQRQAAVLEDTLKELQQQIADIEKKQNSQ
jgi:hypothetical protein